VTNADFIRQRFDELKRQNNEQRERFGLPLIKVTAKAKTAETANPSFSVDNTETKKDAPARRATEKDDWSAAWGEAPTVNFTYLAKQGTGITAQPTRNNTKASFTTKGAGGAAMNQNFTP